MVLRIISIIGAAVTLGMKSGVQPWMGCGSKAGCEQAGLPSALRFVGIPDASSPAASGSAKMIFTLGRANLRCLPAPRKVPGKHK